MVVHNPNNWHWVDKNCTSWSKDYFNEKVVGLSVVTEENTSVGVTSLLSLEGDVEVCQRKGKVISIFDLKLTLTIGGYSEDEKNKKGEFKGSIIIPELAYDTEPEELQFDISIYNENKENEKMRKIIKSYLIPKLRDVLSNFGHDLIVTHSSDIQLESDKVNSTYTKANQTGNQTAPQPKSVPSKSTATPAPSAPVTNSNVPRYNTSTLHLEPDFNTTAEQLYTTLLDGQRVMAWSRSVPEIEAFPPKEGSSFKLFGGSISGRFLKLVPNERIVQLWRLEDWKSGHYAELDIQFKQGAGETKMVVKWSGIPIGEEERVKDNFENYYIRSIKITFGFGAVL